MTDRSPFVQIQKTVLYEEVAKQIKEAIHSGQYQPGERLPSERELSESFGVGRPTIREALRLLSVRGLVQIDRGMRGYVVKTPDIEQYVDPIRDQISWLVQANERTIPEFWDVIPYVIGMMAHAASRLIGEKDFVILEKYIEDMKSCGRDFCACQPITYAFGLHLAEVTKNRLLIILWRLFRDVISREFAPLLNKFEPEGPRKLIEYHQEMLAALKAKDHEAISRAARARREHLQNLAGPWLNQA